MRKFILFIAVVFAFGFDIDEFDKGIKALENGENSVAYDIFYKGCELNDDLSCEELGIMYVNGDVSTKEDNTVNENNRYKIGLSYIKKSCDLGYLNACGDIVLLKSQNEVGVDDALYNYALKKYNELAKDYLEPAEANVTN